MKSERPLFERAVGLFSVLLLCALAPARAWGMVDLDGDGTSEFWTLLHPEVEADDADPDGDGQSNWSEMMAGTDPLDPSSSFALQAPEFLGEELVLRWQGVAGKLYVVQAWDIASESWQEVSTASPAMAGGVREVVTSRDGAFGMYRLGVSDFDGDGDGVSAWEEAVLGWNDQSPMSGDRENVPDFEGALRALESGVVAQLAGGRVLPQRLPSPGEASRFLVQSSFGPNLEEIEIATQLGLVRYFDQQVAVTPTKTGTSMWRTGASWSALLWRHGWWRTALIAPDQLRQRMAYALSQIFVVNTEPGTVLGDNSITQASYYDLLVEKGLGSYREILEDVTYSPSMGFYLSHLNNRKSAPEINRFPDENFAREIMQLFSIGLWQLYPDGSRKLDENGDDIPTYDNEVITGMAKIFTGMSNGTTMRGRPATSFYDSATGQDYIAPMIVWDEEHEAGEKVIFNGIVIPGDQTGEDDVQQTLDELANHENVAPFISRLLIQRFTCSNPSAEYIGRVSHAWNRSDGDLTTALGAILFDPEARTVGSGNGTRGKVREPLLRMTHIMRALAPPDYSGNHTVSARGIKEAVGQFAMSSPSVFNFYSPDFTPQGEFTELGLVSPEMQIATTSSLLSGSDLLRLTGSNGHAARGNDFTEELALAENPLALVEHLDLLFTFGEMSASTRATLESQVRAEFHANNKVRFAIQTLIASPDFTVLK